MFRNCSNWLYREGMRFLFAYEGRSGGSFIKRLLIIICWNVKTIEAFLLVVLQVK